MRTFLLALVSAWLLAGCSSSPSETEGRTAFEARLRAGVNNAEIRVGSFQKTNGQAFETDGAPSYRLFYSAQATFPRGYRTDCITERGTFRGPSCALPDAQGRLPPKAAGATAYYAGVVTFQQTERGWVASNVTLTESARPITVEPEPIRIANPGSDRLKALSPLNQRIGLMRAIRADRKTCRRVIGLAYQQQHRDLAMWVVLCATGGNWAVFIAPNEDVQVRDCRETVGLGLPACRPVPPLPPDPTAPAGTEVNASETEAANRNLTNGL